MNPIVTQQPCSLNPNGLDRIRRVLVANPETSNRALENHRQGCLCHALQIESALESDIGILPVERHCKGRSEFGHEIEAALHTAATAEASGDSHDGSDSADSSAAEGTAHVRFTTARFLLEELRQLGIRGAYINCWEAGTLGRLFSGSEVAISLPQPTSNRNGLTTGTEALQGGRRSIRRECLRLASSFDFPSAVVVQYSHAVGRDWKTEDGVSCSLLLACLPDGLARLSP